MISLLQNIPSEVVAAIIGASALLISKLIDLLYKKLSTKNDKNDFSYLNKDYEIDKLLWEKLKEFNADRVYLCQFHNGGKYQSGMSMKKFTMTNEVTSDAIQEPSINFFKERLVSEFTGIFRGLIFDKKYECENANIEEDALVQNTLKKFGEGSFYLYLIEDINKAPLGYVGLHYNEHKVLSKEQKEVLANFSQSLVVLVKSN
mgnify:CR=1 FL=1